MDAAYPGIAATAISPHPCRLLTAARVYTGIVPR
jgi:hypothetical protein